MDSRKHADSLLWSFKDPELESLIRNATPLAQRRFALACARLAACNAGLAEYDADHAGWNDPVIWDALSVAEHLVRGEEVGAERIAGAREAAERRQRELDDIHLKIGEVIDRDLERGGSALEHPQHANYRYAFRQFAAALAVACSLHDDALEAAAQCAYQLDRGLAIDRATIRAIARDVLR